MRSLETMVDQKGGINSVQHIADLIRYSFIHVCVRIELNAIF